MISKDDLQIIIKDIIDSGSIVFTGHAKKRMGMRGYTVHDVLNILMDGEIEEITEEKNDRYKCKVIGQDIEGDPGSVVVEVVKKTKAIIITVLGGV